MKKQKYETVITFNGKVTSQTVKVPKSAGNGSLAKHNAKLAYKLQSKKNY